MVAERENWGFLFSFFSHLFRLLVPLLPVVCAPELLSSGSFPPVGISFSKSVRSPLSFCGSVLSSSMTFGSSDGPGSSESWAGVDSASLLACLFLWVLGLTCSLAGSKIKKKRCVQSVQSVYECVLVFILLHTGSSWSLFWGRGFSLVIILCSLC